MTGGLCDALTGRCDGQPMLEALERGNLFVVPLDDERRWYRYHDVADQARDTQAELGWVLDPAHTGDGYATAAVHELLRYCFADLACAGSPLLDRSGEQRLR